MKVSISYIITDEKVKAFATLLEDLNPVYLDEEYIVNSL